MLTFFWSIVCVNQIVTCLEAHAQEDFVVPVSASYSYTSYRVFFAVCLYVPVVVPIQISAVRVLNAGQILMISMQKMLHEAHSQLWSLELFTFQTQIFSYFSWTLKAVLRLTDKFCTTLDLMHWVISFQFLFRSASKISCERSETSDAWLFSLSTPIDWY